MSYYFRKSDLKQAIIVTLIIAVIDLILGSPFFWYGYNKTVKIKK